MTFKKALLSTAVVIGLTTSMAVSANELDLREYAANQSTQLPEVGEYDGFIVYLKESNDAKMGIQGIQNGEVTLAGVSNVKVIRMLSTGGLVVKSASDLGIFRSSASGASYQAEQDAQLFRELRAHPDVLLAEPNLRMQVAMVPSDPDYSRLWGLSSVRNGINVESSWDTYRGQGVNVAVIDTGIVSHSDLNQNVRGGYDFISSSFTSQDGDGRDGDPSDEGDYHYRNECDPNANRNFVSSSWHGTHVAGTIAMVGNNGRGGIGVAPESTIVPIRVLGKCGGTSADIADAIKWAAGGQVSGVPSNSNPAQVINMSLGGRSNTCPYTYQNAINSAVSNGATVIIAAGNSNMNVSGFTPANCNNVVTVASLGSTGNRAGYSNYGSKIDVAAPGGDQSAIGSSSGGIYSTVDRGSRTPIGEGYTFMDGTSMASPHVAGVAALLKQKEPNLSPSQVEQRLKDGTRPIPGLCSQGCGAGIVDVALTLGTEPPPPPPGDEALTKDVPVNIASLSRGEELEYTFAVPNGATNVVIKTYGGSGDVDLKVQHETSSYPDCNLAAYGNDETCRISSPRAGEYRVTLLAYSTSSNFSVVATYEVDSGGEEETDFTLNKTVYSGQTIYSREHVVTGSGYIKAGMTAADNSADLDLYLEKKSSYGSWSSVASSLKSAGQDESINYRASTGTYRWKIKSYRGTSSMALTYSMPQ